MRLNQPSEIPFSWSVRSGEKILNPKNHAPDTLAHLSHILSAQTIETPIFKFYSMNKKSIKKFTGLFIFFFAGIAVAFAQMPQQTVQPADPASVTDTEMEQFAGVFVELQTMNQQIQQEMVTAVQEEGIEVQRFNEIMNAQQDPNQEVDATQEELELFAAAGQAIQQIQQGAQQDMQKVITDSELSLPRYQSIMAALQNDAGLQQRLQEEIQQ